MGLTTKPTQTKSDAKNTVRKVRKTVSKASPSHLTGDEFIGGIVRSEKTLDEIAREQGIEPQTFESLAAKAQAIYPALWETEKEFEEFWRGIERRQR